MKTSASVRPCWTLALLFCAAILCSCVAGCGTDAPTQPPADTYLPQTSPGATLANLRHAYNAHNVAALAHYPALFDSTTFRRFFEGTHPPGHFAESWGYSDEHRSFETFVQDPTLVSYVMTWADSATATGAPGGTLTDPPGTLRYTFSQVTVDIEHAAVGATLRGSYVIDVAPFATTGVAEWRIVRWRDATQ